MIAAAAVAIALGACTSGTAAVPSSTSSTDPATAQIAKALVGNWLTTPQPGNAYLTVFHPDGTVTWIESARSLVNDETLETFPYRVDGDKLVYGGPKCFITMGFHQSGEGSLRLDPEVYGRGCTQTSGEPEQQLTRLTPSSAAAGQALAAASQGSKIPLTDSMQIEGIWVVRGSGEVFAFDKKTGNRYRLDSSGQIDTSPDDKGWVDVGTGGTVVLTSSSGGCATSTTLSDATSQGTAPADVVHAKVTSDDCHRFHGAAEIDLVQVM